MQSWPFSIDDTCRCGWLLHRPAPLSQDVRPDRKQRCPRCGEHRSFTLITAAGDCALCVAQLDEPVPETLPQDRSCWWVHNDL